MPTDALKWQVTQQMREEEDRLVKAIKDFLKPGYATQAVNEEIIVAVHRVLRSLGIKVGTIAEVNKQMDEAGLTFATLSADSPGPWAALAGLHIVRVHIVDDELRVKDVIARFTVRREPQSGIVYIDTWDYRKNKRFETAGPAIGLPE